MQISLLFENEDIAPGWFTLDRTKDCGLRPTAADLMLGHPLVNWEQEMWCFPSKKVVFEAKSQRKLKISLLNENKSIFTWVIRLKKAEKKTTKKKRNKCNRCECCVRCECECDMRTILRRILKQFLNSVLSCLLLFRWSFSLPFKLNCLSENTLILVLTRIFSVFFDFRLQKPPFSKENTTFLVLN